MVRGPRCGGPSILRWAPTRRRRSSGCWRWQRDGYNATDRPAPPQVRRTAALRRQPTRPCAAGPGRLRRIEHRRDDRRRERRRRTCAGGTGSAERRSSNGRPSLAVWEASDAKRLRSLEDENRRLKKLLAEQLLDNAALKDLVGKNF